MTEHAHGTFAVTMETGPAELDGRVARSEFAKTFSGDLEGTSRVLMLSVGDPSTGRAGYVALEVVQGRVGDREGSFVLQQYGQMDARGPRLLYDIASGSGADDFEGIEGRLDLVVTDGVHHYDIAYTLPT